MKTAVILLVLEVGCIANHFFIDITHRVSHAILFPGAACPSSPVGPWLETWFGCLYSLNYKEFQRFNASFLPKKQHWLVSDWKGRERRKREVRSSTRPPRNTESWLTVKCSNEFNIFWISLIKKKICFRLYVLWCNRFSNRLTGDTCLGRKLALDK